jgi:hypothetical protein
MSEPEANVDAAHVMTHTLHTSSVDPLEQLSTAAAGRFGRQIGTIGQPDPELALPRRLTVTRMRARMTAGEYRIDPLVVAGEIVDRVGAAGFRIAA